MYKKILDYIKEKPPLYFASTSQFWDDEHISKGMLAAHLNFDVESTSRKQEDIVNSVAWISKTFFSKEKNTLLDLGCGPGLYTELFYKAGLSNLSDLSDFHVTGIDFSARSIEYAIKSAKSKNLAIEYIYQDYLKIDYKNTFDFVSLIYCDFGVLSSENRKTLLTLIKKSLRDGGVFILDAFTPHQFSNFSESRAVQYYEQGYWSTEPHMCIQSNYFYPESKNSLEQYVLVTESNCECYNIWNQAFTAQSLKQELLDAGFKNIDFYDDTTGKPFTGTSNTLCAVAK